MQKQNNIVLLTTLLTFIGLTTVAMGWREEIFDREEREATPDLEDGSEHSSRFTTGRTTALHEAIKNRNKKEVKRVLMRFEVNINCRDEEGRTPLYIAEQMGLKSIANLLRLCLANPSFQAHGGRNANSLGSKKQKDSSKRCQLVDLGCQFQSALDDISKEEDGFSSDDEDGFYANDEDGFSSDDDSCDGYQLDQLGLKNEEF